jgi:hypothetical protein
MPTSIAPRTRALHLHTLTRRKSPFLPEPATLAREPAVSRWSIKERPQERCGLSEYLNAEFRGEGSLRQVSGRQPFRKQESRACERGSLGAERLAILAAHPLPPRQITKTAAHSPDGRELRFQIALHANWRKILTPRRTRLSSRPLSVLSLRLYTRCPKK